MAANSSTSTTPVLEQAAHAFAVAGFQQVGRVALLHVLRQHDHGQPGMVIARLGRGPQAIVGERRLHANINNVFSVVWPEMFPGLDPFRDSLHILLITTALAAAVLVVTTGGRLGNPTATGGRYAPDQLQNRQRLPTPRPTVAITLRRR